MIRTYVTSLVAIAAMMALVATNASASTIIDLTTAGSNNFNANNVAASGTTFFVQQTTGQSIGGGVVDSFVRLQTTEKSEQGYNTDARPLQFDEKDSLKVTHSLSLSDVPTVSLTVNGTTELFRQFVLDVNQNDRRPDLSLNQVQIFLRDFPDLAGATTQFPATTTTPPVIAFVDPFSSEVFRLNNNDPKFLEIQLRDTDTPKGGPGDMFLYVPDSAFQAVVAANPDRTYVYLYSQFGKPPGEDKNNGRYEEWGVVNSTPVPIPEPSTVALALMGLGTLGFAGLHRRARASKS